MNYICPEDRELVKEDTRFIKIKCVNHKCTFKFFYVMEEFKSKYITCPHCNTEYKVKCFKNGKTRIIGFLKKDIMG